VSIGLGVGAGVGFGGAPVDPIAAAVAKYGGFWLDPDFAGALTLNTQPVIADVTDPANWTAMNSAVLTDVGAALRVADNAAVNPFGRCTFGGVTGNRQLTTAVGRNDGSANVCSLIIGYAWSRLEFTTNSFESKTGEYTLAGDVVDIGYLDGAATPGWWGELQSAIAVNLSITTLTPRLVSAAFAGGTFTQATADRMFWKSFVGGSSPPVNGKTVMYGEDVRQMVGMSKESTRFLHDGTGCTVLFTFKTSLVKAYAFLFNNIGDGLSVGADLYVQSSGVVSHRVANMLGSATYSLGANSAAGTIVANTMTLLSVRVDAAHGSEIRKNGVVVASDATPGTFGAGDSTNDLTLGYSVAADYGLQGCEGDSVFITEWVSDEELAAMEAKLIAKFGIV
jgi:hypothetical protein